MAFGLIQWLMSFTVFFVVMAIIIWSVLHLGQKDPELIATRFLDRDDYLNHKKHKSLNSTIVINATSAVIESTNDTPPFADHQGLEVSDSAQLHKILQAILSTKERAVSSAQDNATASTATAIFTSSVIDHGSAWNEGITAATDMSAESTTVDDRWSIDEEVVKLSTRTPQTAHSTMPHEYRMFPDTERSRKPDIYPSDEMKFSDLPRDKENGTSNASAVFSLVRLSLDSKQTNTIKHMEGTDATHIPQNEQLETETKPLYSYTTVYITKDP